jgi:hypothetical protein
MNNTEGSQGRIDGSGDELGDINRKATNIASEVREGISKIVDGVKERISTDAVRKVSETASQVSDQVRGYIDDRGMRGLANDATAVIRRYPVPAVVLGVLVGVLLARPRGD